MPNLSPLRHGSAEGSESGLLAHECDRRVETGPNRRRTASRAPGLVRLVAFFAILGSAILACDFLLNSGLRRLQTSSFGVSNRVLSGRARADILISGSSRALTHYDPRIIERQTGRTAFNIGINGSQTDMQVARLRTYLRHNPKPALLIHNLDLFSFQVTHGGVFHPAQYLPYLNEPEIYRALRRINPEVWKSRYLPLYGFAVEDLRFTWLLGIGAWIGWQPNEDHHSGFLPRYSSWTGDFERFRESNPDGVRFEVEPDGLLAMQDLMTTCRDHGIPVLLVYSPEYSEMQAMTSNRAEVFQQFEELRSRFGAVLWDFSHSPISRDRRRFYNSQHLNADGAAEFTRELCERLVPHLASVTAERPEK